MLLTKQHRFTFALSVASLSFISRAVAVTAGTPRATVDSLVTAEQDVMAALHDAKIKLSQRHPKAKGGNEFADSCGCNHCSSAGGGEADSDPIKCSRDCVALSRAAGAAAATATAAAAAAEEEAAAAAAAATEALLLDARVALLDSNMERAAALCAKVLWTRPSDPRARLYMGAISGSVGEWEAAVAHMEAAMGSPPFFGTAATAIPVDGAVDDTNHGAPTPLFVQMAAILNLAALARGGRLGPDEDARAELMFLMEGLRRAAAAGAALPSALAAGAMPGLSENAGLLVRVGDVLAAEGQLVAAARVYQRALLLDNKHEPALRGLGETSRRLGQRRLQAVAAATPASEQLPTMHFAADPLCRWNILHPLPGSTLAPNESVVVEFDTAWADPLESSYSSFGGGDGKGGGSRGDRGGLGGKVFGGSVGIMVCSSLAHGHLANCAPRLSLTGLPLGQHTLTAEAFSLPGLQRLPCPPQRVTFHVVGNDDSGAAGGNGTPDGAASAAAERESHNDHVMGARSHGTAGMRPEGDTGAKQLDLRSAPVLPLRVVTIVLNGMPFLTHHLGVLEEFGRKLSTAAAAAATATANPSAAEADGGMGFDSPAFAADQFWEWHIVEGLAARGADRDRPYSGHRAIPSKYYDVETGLSTDGTTAYLDAVTAAHSNVFVHRLCASSSGRSRSGAAAGDQRAASGKAKGGGDPAGGGGGTGDVRGGGAGSGCHWVDKAQMMNAAVFAARVSYNGGSGGGGDLLLLEIDSDELWTADQLVALRLLFLEQRGGRNAVKYGNGKRCAYFHCHYYVGPDLVTVTANGYGHSDDYEWLRAWILPAEAGAAALFFQHAPPVLAVAGGGGDSGNDGGHSVDGEREGPGDWSSQLWLPLTGHECLGRDETAPRGLVFTHFAYALEAQAAFKEHFYGAPNHVEGGNSFSTSSDESGAERRAGSSEQAGNSVLSSSRGAEQWQAMQRAVPPLRLADYLPWLREAAVGDPRLLETLADRAERHPSAAAWSPPLPLAPFLNLDLEEATAHVTAVGGRTPRPAVPPTASPGANAAVSACAVAHVVADGVAFQRGGPRGYTRVWENALAAMAKRLAGREGTCLTLLARGTAPLPPAVLAALGIGVSGGNDGDSTDGSGSVERRGASGQFRIVHMPPHTEGSAFVSDQLMLAAALQGMAEPPTAFVSTEFTFPHRVAMARSLWRVFLLHDMTPERFGWPRVGVWHAKTLALADADAVVAVSNATALDYGLFRPQSRRVVTDLRIAHNGVDLSVFRRASDGTVDAFRTAHGLGRRPYVILVGPGGGYKNAATVYRALLHSGASVGGGGGSGEEGGMTLVTVGKMPPSPLDASLLNGIFHRHVGVLTDAELAAAYSGAVAHVQMALNEGFGLTVVEAMACGCPVVVADTPVFREVTGGGSGDGDGNGGGGDDGDGGGGEDGGGGADGGVILIPDPLSATQVWRGIRALAAAGQEARRGMGAALAARMRRFGSWQPLADVLIDAALAGPP